MENFKKYLRVGFCLILVMGMIWPVLAASKDKNYSLSHLLEVGGIVMDIEGNPLIGVNVLVKDKDIGTATDFDGRFTLSNLEEDDVLVVSYIGYQTQEYPLNGRVQVEIVLQSDAELLDEVVVVGYGTQKKSDITGSVTSVKVDELNQGVVSSVDQILVGKSSGVNVVQGSGEPGAGFSINIRGSGSINAGNSPLYVIDGMPIDNSRAISRNNVGIGNSETPRSSLSSISPSDIESIEILKDASATAIYGARGANGVILITTKKGNSGKASINYHGSIGVQNWHNKLNLLNANDYKRVLNEIIEEGGADPAFKIGDNIENTDWQEQIANNNALVQNHQISASGGIDKLKYYISLNMMDQDGIIQNSSFNRYGGRLNLEAPISDKLTVGVNLTNSYILDNFIPNGGAAIENSGALQAAYTYDPTIGVRDENGVYLRNELISVDNPVALVKGVDSKSITNRTLITSYVNYSIFDNLSTRVSFGRDYFNESRKTFVYDITRLGSQNNGIGNNQVSNRSHILTDWTVDYNKEFGIHQFNALLGLNYERFQTERLNNTSRDFPSLTVGPDNLGLGARDNFVLSNSKVANSLSSFFTRVNYTLNERFLFTLTARLDGSSRFGENNKYGFFPSGAFGWKLHEEDFLKGVKYIDVLKLRSSWGRSGNQGIGNYAALSTFGQGDLAILDGVAVTTTSPTRIPNPNLKWETTEQINLGVDFELWQNRIGGNVDFFIKNTHDMLLSLPIPSSTGFRTQLTNVGEIKNTGFELTLNTWNVDSKNFQWNSNISFSTLKNEVVSLGPVPEIIVGGAPTWGGGVGVIRPGDPLYSFIGWEVEGIWQLNDDYSQTIDNVSPGDIKFRDVNLDGTINDEDRLILGNSFPDFQVSIGNTFKFGDLSFFFFFDGVQGVEMLNTKMVESFYPINFRRNKLAEPYLNRWTETNPTNEYPSFVNPTNQGVRSVNSFTVEDASYIKLRSLRLSYNLPINKKIGRSAEVYITGENLITITQYSGIDPALNSNGSANYRIDLNSYPSSRTYMLGFNINF